MSHPPYTPGRLMCLSAPSVPKQPAPPPPPTPQDPAVVAARLSQKKKAAMAYGRQSTILTSPSGVGSSGAGATFTKTALGA